MRTAVLVLLMLAFAGVAWATDPAQFVSPEPIAVPAIEQDVIHYQPPHAYWWTINASSPFGSALADDVPEELLPCVIEGFIFYALEWGGYWIDPLGFWFWHHWWLPPWICLPDPIPNHGDFIAWDDPMVTKVLVYDDPGWMTAYEVTVMFGMPMCMTEPGSSAWQLDLAWGQTPPYGGVTMTNDNDIYGCGEAYWDGTYWGYPRWGTISGYFGTQADVAYGLIGSFGPSANLPATWGAVKSLYR